MYPSIEFPLVKKAILYFTMMLPKNQKSTIELCLGLIPFGVISTVFTFGENVFYSMVGNVSKQRVWKLAHMNQPFLLTSKFLNFLINVTIS